MSESLSFDRDAWLYPYYATLKADHGSIVSLRCCKPRLSPTPCRRTIRLKPRRSATTALAMLTWLDTATRTRPRHRETELWRLRKGDRELRCVPVYLPTGIDV